MGLLDYIGDLDQYVGDDDMIGAPRRRAMVRAPMRAQPVRAPVAQAQAFAQQQMRDRRVMAANAIQSAAPGVPKPGPREEPMGFPTFTFTNVSGTTISQTTRPQKPFKGGRLVIDLSRTGAGATGLVSVGSLLIGSRNVLVNSNPIGAGSFAPNAVGVTLAMDECGPGIDIVLQLLVSVAPGAGERIDVAATIIGLTWS